MNSLPFSQHPKRTILDWAKEEGWTNLRFNVNHNRIYGYPPGETTEVEVSEEVIRDLAPHYAKLKLDEVEREWLQCQLEIAKDAKELFDGDWTAAEFHHRDDLIVLNNLNNHIDRLHSIVAKQANLA